VNEESESVNRASMEMAGILFSLQICAIRQDNAHSS
jgi:hypothetical protein